MNKTKIHSQLLSWFNEMTSKYEWLSFRYEYSTILGVYLVGYYPSFKVDECDEFCIDAMRFEDSMNAEYGDEAPLFGNEEECFRFSNKACTYIKPIRNTTSQFDYNYSTRIELQFGYTEYEYEGYAIENIAA